MNDYVARTYEHCNTQKGPVRESNPGPLAPKARIIPLDQLAALHKYFHRLIHRNGDIPKHFRSAANLINARSIHVCATVVTQRFSE